MGAILKGVRSDELLAEESQDSARQIQRYIRLLNLCPGLLDLVDDGKIALRPAVELSYLTEDEQSVLLDTIVYDGVTPSHAQAIRMRHLSEQGQLNETAILGIMNEEKPNQRKKLSISSEILRRYIPESYTPREAEDYVLKALEHYKKYRERQRDAR